MTGKVQIMWTLPFTPSLVLYSGTVGERCWCLAGRTGKCKILPWFFVMTKAFTLFNESVKAQLKPQATWTP